MTAKLDDVLQESVFSPWKKLCQDSPFPWRATPDLRLEWRGMILSSESEVAMAGAIALSRTSRLSEEEFEEVENYFNNLGGGQISPETLAMVLLSGASPPHLFIQSFLTLCLLDQEGWGDSFYWSLFSSYVRHPHSAGLPVGRMFVDGQNGKIQYLLKCNPMDDTTGWASRGNWFSALRCFRKGEEELRAGRKTEIAVIAKSLRVDSNPTMLRKSIEVLCLDSVIERSLAEHPVLRTGGGCAEFDHTDPSRESIDFFSGSDDVSKIWRFYNPLLIPPWMMEPLDVKETPLLYIGKLLCGMIPRGTYSGPAKTVVGRILIGHPFLILDFEGSKE